MPQDFPAPLTPDKLSTSKSALKEYIKERYNNSPDAMQLFLAEVKSRVKPGNPLKTYKMHAPLRSKGANDVFSYQVDRLSEFMSPSNMDAAQRQDAADAINNTLGLDRPRETRIVPPEPQPPTPPIDEPRIVPARDEAREPEREGERRGVPKPPTPYNELSEDERRAEAQQRVLANADRVRNERIGLDVEAKLSSTGDLYGAEPTSGSVTVFTGGKVRELSSHASNLIGMGRIGNLIGISQDFNRKTTTRSYDETKKVHGTVYRKIPRTYPSPGSASHGDVLEQWLTAQTENVAVFGVPGAKVEPDIVRRERAHDVTPNQREHMDIAIQYAKDIKQEYIAALAKAKADAMKEPGYVETDEKAKRRKDAVALDIIEKIYKASDGPQTLVRDDGSTMVNPGYAEVGNLNGNRQKVTYGKDIETTFDGSTLELRHYRDAVKRNSSRYGAHGEYQPERDKSEYFAVAKSADYSPGIETKSPPIRPTKEQEAQGRINELDAKLQADIDAVHHVPRSSGRNSYIASPDQIEAALRALKEDVADHKIGNNGGIAEVATLLANDQDKPYSNGSYAHKRNALPGEASSVQAVLDAYKHPGGVDIDKNPKLAKDIAVAAKYLAEAVGFATVQEPAAGQSGAVSNEVNRPTTTRGGRSGQR